MHPGPTPQATLSPAFGAFLLTSIASRPLDIAQLAPSCPLTLTSLAAPGPAQAILHFPGTGAHGVLRTVPHILAAWPCGLCPGLRCVCTHPQRAARPRPLPVLVRPPKRAACF